MIDLIATGANRVPQPAGRYKSGLVFASQCLLVDWDTAGVTKVFDLGSQVTAVVGDGRTVVAGTQDGVIYLFDGEHKKAVSLPKAVNCLSLDAGTLAAGSSDGSVTLYELDAGNKLLVQKSSFHIRPMFYPLAVAVHGEFVAVGGTCGSVFLRHGDETVELPGHDNWVRSLSFKKDGETLILASASQDRYIRLWRICDRKLVQVESELTMKLHRLGSYVATFEALLIGHDDWVVSVEWSPSGNELLSASSDSSLIVWTPGEKLAEAYDLEDELWTPHIRLGDISIMGASTATGASGGFWTALWFGDYVATVSKMGSWRLWDRHSWAPVPGVTGHTKVVTDVAWLGDCVLSTSLDQTTRLWAKTNLSDAVSNLNKGYHEISRPQIHGYDMLCVQAIGSNKFISAGDEKTLRVFSEPKPVSELLQRLAGSSLGDYDESCMPSAATVPALGLSNKAVEQTQAAEAEIEGLPREDHLQRLTLWPEVEKLYGHGYEISCLDVSPNNDLVATCCKATNTKHAVIRLYTTHKWRQLEPLEAHSLTVTRCRFSPGGKYLLTVSRDRQWTTFTVDSMTVAKAQPKAHSRIIWDCAWLSDSEFVTASRDKSVKKWTLDGTCTGTAQFPSPVTACDASEHVVAVGLENGTIVILDLSLNVLTELKAEGRISRVRLNGNKLAVASLTLRIYDLANITS